MKVLLVGGGGFIGSVLARILAAENVDTVILDNFSSEFQQRALKGVTVIDGDMTSKEIIEAAMKGVTHVWHGAYPHNIDSRTDSVETVWGNIKATTQLARLARLNRVKKFVYVSSRSVYGRAQYNPVDEKHPIQPVTSYGLCKAICEENLNNILGDSETKLCVLRGFLVYGPGDRQSVVSKFVKLVLKGKPISIFGDGSATRDFIHVEDMASAAALALTVEEATGEFNIGSGEETPLLQLIDILTKITERDNIVTHFVQKEAWNVDDRCFADISRARGILGFKPRISLEDGLSSVIRDVRSNDQNA